MLLIMSAVLSVLLHVLLFPVEMISMLFLSQETVDTSVGAFRYAAASTVPLLLVGVCRYFSVDMFENAFFAGLATHDAALAQAIRQVTATLTLYQVGRRLIDAATVAADRKKRSTGTGSTSATCGALAAPAWLRSGCAGGQAPAGCIDSDRPVWLQVRALFLQVGRAGLLTH